MPAIVGVRSCIANKIEDYFVHEGRCFVDEIENLLKFLHVHPLRIDLLRMDVAISQSAPRVSVFLGNVT